MAKRALLIAFHYPPVSGSSGLQRALKFSTYLGENDWDCDVLTIWPGAYEKRGNNEMADIPAGVEVVRAMGLDAKRHLSLFGSYPQFMALPDRWASWEFDAVRRGLALLKKRRYHIIWSTFPIATAHAIGLKLARKSGLPWVADCRDSMSEEGYPREPAAFRSVRQLEENVVRNASAVVFTAPGAQKMYADRYPDVSTAHWRVIENGYDESTFNGLQPYDPARTLAFDAPLVLVHSGILYPSERDPLPFFRAIQALNDRGVLAKNPIKVILRATGHDEHYRPLLQQLGIEDVVTLEPAVAYREALQEMMLADGLLIFQAANCNHQIPAKLYEYLRAGRPIMALTDEAGDTASVLAKNACAYVCKLDDQGDIERQMTAFLSAVRNGSATVSEVIARQYSRRAQTQRLAALFDELSDDAS